MPSVLHEALVVLFRNRPTLAAELLAGPLGIGIPPFSSVRFESTELGDVVPPEYRADLALVLVDEDGAARLAIVLEPQLGIDARKRFTWPVYVTSLRARLGCPVLLLVVAVDAAVARFASEPIDLGPPGFTLRPTVLGPDAVPLVVDEEAARGAPELAVLSALAHARSPRARDVARAALAAAACLDEERAGLYADLVFASLGDAARAALEDLMLNGKYEPLSDFAKHHYAQGLAAGEARGEALGEARGEARSILAFLEARGLCVTDDVRARILACDDLATLDAWVRRAATVESAAALFD
jgi:hypothetical protein